MALQPLRIGPGGRSRENFRLSHNPFLLTYRVLHGPFDAIAISMVTGILEIAADPVGLVPLIVNQPPGSAELWRSPACVADSDLNPQVPADIQSIRNGKMR